MNFVAQLVEIWLRYQYEHKITKTYTVKKKIALSPAPSDTMKVTTRSSNASKHPGMVNGGSVKRKRWTRAEMEADAAKKELEKVSLNQKRKATISRIAALEDQMVKQDVEAQSKSREGQRSQTSCEVADKKTGSEFQPDSDASETLTSDDAETHELDVATPKPKKMKLSIRQEIKAVHVKAATELENTKGRVGFLI